MDEPLELSADFLDDFYTECDEYLTGIRQGLVALESSVGRAQPEMPVIERLFRHFHSFKGNSAIVGLHQAEKLAHAAEDYLRALSKSAATLTALGLDLLMSTTQRLEQLVSAHREKKNLPEVDDLAEKLKLLGAGRGPSLQQIPVSPREGGSPAKAGLGTKIDEAFTRGNVVWKFEFCPSRELDARGVNLAAIRERIGNLGQILEASPEINADGSVHFHFVAALTVAPTELAPWENDGVSVEPWESAAESPQDAKKVEAESSSSSFSGAFVAPSHVVRVDLSRLDELIRITGEMVIQRARLEDQISRLPGSVPDAELRTLQETSLRLGRYLRELREGIMNVRLVPMAEIFSRMPFVVRDLGRESGKKVRLSLSGQQTEIDKYLVERLKDPLLHLVRNSVSHGIESAAERVAHGKPEEATIFLRASTIGDSVLIELGDDGKGIDAEAVLRHAEIAGIPRPAIVNNHSLLQLICAHGFSTRDEADRAAGRGVGMAVVYDTIRELGGTLSMESEKNRGARFSMRLPLTLAIADVFILTSNNQTCAVPQSFVREIFELNSLQVRRLNGTEVISYRDGLLPLVRLRSMFGSDSAARANPPVLVLTSERGSAGLVVDGIHGQREVVVRAINDPLIQVTGIAGATELGDGKPVLILDASALTSGMVRTPDQIITNHSTPIDPVLVN
jgi:two-component system chemotaxis sensor kinase CheA